MFKQSNRHIFQHLYAYEKQAVLLLQVEEHGCLCFYANKAAETIFGIHPEQLDADRLFHMKPAKWLTMLLNQAGQQKQPITDVFLYGKNEWTVRITPTESPQWFSVMVDCIPVVEHVEEHPLFSLIHYNSDAVFELNSAGIISFVNNEALTQTNFSQQDLLHRSFFTLFHDHRAEIEHIFASIKQSSVAREIDATLFTQKPSRLSVRLKFVPIFQHTCFSGAYVIMKSMHMQRQLERLLQESGERYQSLYDHYPNAIFTQDVNGLIISGNDEASYLLGQPVEDIIGQSFLSLVAPDDVVISLERFEQSVRTRKPQSYEITMIHRSGKHIELTVIHIPIVANGQLTGMYTIGKDITAENHLKAEINRKNHYLEAIWQSAIEPIALFHVDGTILKVSPGFVQTFGYSEEELLGRMNPSVLPEDAEMMKSAQEKVQNGERLSLPTVKRRTKQGTLVDIMASYTPVYTGENGELTGCLAFYKNITALKQTEHELRTSRQKYKIIMDHVFDSIAMISTSGKFLYTSPSTKKIFGYTFNDLTTEQFLQLVHPEDLAGVERLLHNVREGRTAKTELRLKHEKGHYLWIQLAITPVVTDGKTEQIISIARDTTSEKKLQLELEQLAFTDALSGLPNRRRFHDMLHLTMKQAAALNSRFYLFMLDGKQFKRINDTYGHDAGDAVIREIGCRLSCFTGNDGMVARLGGDEFAVILNEECCPHPQQWAEQLALEISRPFHYNGQRLHISAGIGIAIYPDHALTKDELIKAADLALYKAKEQEYGYVALYR